MQVTEHEHGQWQSGEKKKEVNVQQKYDERAKFCVLSTKPKTKQIEKRKNEGNKRNSSFDQARTTRLILCVLVGASGQCRRCRAFTLSSFSFQRSLCLARLVDDRFVGHTHTHTPKHLGSSKHFRQISPHEQSGTGET